MQESPSGGVIEISAYAGMTLFRVDSRFIKFLWYWNFVHDKV